MKRLKNKSENQQQNVATDINSTDLLGMMGSMNNMGFKGPTIGEFNQEEATEVIQEQAPIENNIDQIVPALVGEIPEDFEKYNIISFCPLCISKEEFEGGAKIAITLKLLCKDISGKLIVLVRNYGLESREELEAISALPMFEDNYFINTKIAADLLINALNTYSTEFDFTCNNLTVDNPEIYLTGKSINGGDIETRFYITTDIYSAINYIDYYIFASISNEHDLCLATGVGYQAPSFSPIFIVDKIEKIVNIAPVDNKAKKKSFKKKDTSTAVGVIAKVSRFVSTTEREVAQVLIPLVLDKKFDKNKFKGKTMTDVMQSYCVDSDQYISTLYAPDSRILGVDKEYTMIRGENKDHNTKIFLLDASTLEELDQMIGEF